MAPVIVRAQRAEPAGVARVSAPLRVDAYARQADAAVRSDGSRVAGTARGMGIGALVGAGVGVLAAFIETNRPDVIDHSEDGFVYLVLVPAGALAGAVIGGVVGYVRAR